MSVAVLNGRGRARRMLEALDIPVTIPRAGPSPGPPGPGPTWEARLRGLLTALAARVPGSAGHSDRVSTLSGLVATRLGLPQAEIVRVECAARVHDVGKIVISPAILKKPAALTIGEYEEVKRHAIVGARLVACLGDPALTAMVRGHHERLDGSGYPDGLRGTEIPLGARIIGIVDTYDALTSRRPYREPLSADGAVEILEEEAGITLDRDAAAAFIS